MIYTRKEISKIYNSTYQLNIALAQKKIFKIQNGLYSTEEYISPLRVITKKYPDAIFTMESAFFYWGLTDVIPDEFHLVTKRINNRFKAKDIRQYFTEEKFLNLGKTTLEVDNAKINIYDQERMLVELIRKRNQISMPYYKEIILNYRKIINELDSFKIMKYISAFNNEKLYEIIQREVY